MKSRWRAFSGRHRPTRWTSTRWPRSPPGVSTRRYASTLDPVPAEVNERATSSSAVSRRFVALSTKRLHAFLSRPLGELDLRVVCIDGKVLRDPLHGDRVGRIPPAESRSKLGLAIEQAVGHERHPWKGHEAAVYAEVRGRLLGRGVDGEADSDDGAKLAVLRPEEYRRQRGTEQGIGAATAKRLLRLWEKVPESTRVEIFLRLPQLCGALHSAEQLSVGGAAVTGRRWQCVHRAGDRKLDWTKPPPPPLEFYGRCIAGRRYLAATGRGGAGRSRTARGRRRRPRRWSYNPPRGLQTQVDRPGDSGSSGSAPGGRRCAYHDESRMAGHAQAPGWSTGCMSPAWQRGHWRNERPVSAS